MSAGDTGTRVDLRDNSLCMDNEVPIMVLSLNEEGSIRRAILGEKIGTLVCSDPK